MRRAGFLRRFLRDFGRNEAAASAAEFALVLPIFLLFLFGIIDAGLYGWTLNRDEKATQMGVRMAVVTNPVVGNLGVDFVGQTVNGTTLSQGDTIPASALGTITCTSTSCDCSQAGSLFSSNCTLNNTAFNYIVARMQKVGWNIQASNVVVEYRGSGLGYAGDESCSAGTGCTQISPLITVKVKGMSYQPLTSLLFKTSIPIPSFSATLSMEDGSGTGSN